MARYEAFGRGPLGRLRGWPAGVRDVESGVEAHVVSRALAERIAVVLNGDPPPPRRATPEDSYRFHESAADPARPGWVLRTTTRKARLVARSADVGLARAIAERLAAWDAPER